MKKKMCPTVNMIALSTLAITVTSGLLSPSWAAAQEMVPATYDSGLESATASYELTTDSAVGRDVYGGDVNSSVLDREQLFGLSAVAKPTAVVNTDSLLNKMRDFSKFSTGNISKDTTLALNIVSWQLPHGGFFKAMEKNYKSKWDGKTARSTWKSKDGVELGTFDNEATTTEIRFLADVYKKTKNKDIKNSVQKAVDFVLTSQYSSGGWPQVYPKRGNYSDAVTYNDDAMVRVMVLADDIVNKKQPFDSDILDDSYRSRLQQALNKGIQYTIKSQIVNNGTPTIWGAQHDPATYASVEARAFELPSKTTTESVGITAFLMSQPQTAEVKKAAQSALKWFDANRIDGIKYNRQGPEFFQKDASSVMWYRFYNVEDNKYFFSDRDGKKYTDIMKISEERRLGYAWAGSQAKSLLKLASDSGYYKLSKPLPQ
ncbi:pectate lyase [Paenibacillus peoriae]|uniref:Pectate lyase n=1 Tax=Paenibacillus peoriae TaxID=59893 RepID=A0A7H0YD09_9BACL|nr:pectate lyase [Paenibacillus peoriae]QNR68967.1 pectate lyase [Paenibacillus peoriae]